MTGGFTQRARSPTGVVLNVYILYIHDDRYSVPTVDSLTAIDDDSAKQRLRERLEASAHYFAVALWQDERLVERIEKTHGAGQSGD
jgi:hypothetical protein